MELAGRSGVVEEVTLRVTKLRAADGSLIFIPNGEIKQVCNTTSGWARVDFRVRVRFEEDLPRVQALLADVLADIAAEFPSEITEPPEFLGVDKLEEKFAVLRAWIKTRPLGRSRVERALNARVVESFSAQGIKLTIV